MNEWLWYVTRASALTATVLLTATVVLGALTAGRGAPFGLSPLVRTGLHRTLSLVMVAFVTLHVVTAITETYVPIDWISLVVPFTAGYEPFWVGLGTIAFDLLGTIMITSLLRTRIPARSWRGVHWATYALWPIALAHGLGSSSVDGTSIMISSGCCAGLGLVAVGWRVAAVNQDSARRRLHTARDRH